MLIIVACLLGATVSLFATLPATDTFTRADGDLGTNWVSQTTNALQIVSNVVGIPGVADFRCSRWNPATDTVTPDQSSDAVIAAIVSGDSLTVTVRSSGSFATGDYNGYLFTADNGFTTIDKVVAGAGSQVLDLSGVTGWAVGNTLKLTVVGSTLTAYRNGGVVGTVTDTALTSGQPGICLFTAAVTATSLDTWTGDTLGGSVPTTRRLLLLGVGHP